MAYGPSERAKGTRAPATTATRRATAGFMRLMSTPLLTIAHGMWTVARCLAAHGTPAAAVMRADFRAPVPLPGTVTFAAEDGLFELRAADGRTHVTGGVYPLVS